MKKQVLLFLVDTDQKKISSLCRVAKKHFDNREHLMIFAADDKALQYIDDLLWKYPEDSFLPHIISQKKTEEYIVITKLRENLNYAKFAFNLCPTPILHGDFQIIYDFEDKTSPHKCMLSQKRFEAYKEAKLIIESR